LLTEPNWAAKEDRDEFIRSLTGLNAPELAPGLIWVLDYDEAPYNRAAAAEALTKYRDPRAIPALRRALEKEKGEQNREKIVTALAECGGLSDDEMAAAYGKPNRERNRSRLSVAISSKLSLHRRANGSWRLNGLPRKETSPNN
jgi:HEAT repeat protein